MPAAKATLTTSQPHYIQSVAGCLSGAISAHGLEPAVMDAALARLEAPLKALQVDRQAGRLPLLQVPDEVADIVAAEAALAKLSEGAGTIVFFGTGGSGLGGQTLAQFAGWNIPGNRGGSAPGGTKRPRTRFYDNLDGETLAGALATLDLATTRFVVISKSGGTVETLAQAVAALSAVKAAGLSARIPELFLGITEPAKPGVANGLRSLLAAHNVPMLEHHTGIGGRFSVLTNVGLLPALARGLDVRALRRGAASVVASMSSATHPRDFAPAVGAATAIALRETRGISTQVMMPYADRLGRLAEWFVQLWAESLGKSGKGTTPLACLGPLDQHSQLQLFMDGPHEHLITVIRMIKPNTGPVLDPALATLAGIGFLGGHGIGELVAAQAHAVPEALTRAQRPVRTFDIPHLDAEALGALLMHFMLETILAASLLGIDAFDQPAVELAKQLTRQRLLKPA
jgi:glucose-6-phosphate isomerase